MTLLEREPLLDQLDRRLAAAATGEGSLVLLAGEAGAGKSSVAREAVRRAGSRVLILWGACDPLATPRPLSPLLDVLADPDSGLTWESDQSLEPVTLFQAVLDRLRRTARPILFVIEDIHWADNGTLDFLRFLGRRVRDTKSLVICTYRDDEVGSEHPLRSVLGEFSTQDSTLRLSVPSLSVDAVQLLSKGPQGEAEQLHALTGGNAFFVTEMIAAGEDMPMSVQDAVLARVSRLKPGARRVVEAVAISPRELEIDFAQAMAHSDLADLDEATAAGVLHGSIGMLRFRHELARSTVEEAIPIGRRLELHRQMIELIQNGGVGDVARLAHHAARANDGQLVAEFGPMAAAEAFRRGAVREAAEYAELVLAYSKFLDPGRLAELRLELVLSYRILNRQDEALEQAELAARHYRLQGDDIGLARSLSRLAGQQWQKSRLAQARETIDQAVALLEPSGASVDLARALYQSASLSMLGRHREVAFAHGKRALQMSHELGSDSVIGINMVNIGTIEIVLGDPEDGVRWLLDSRRWAEEHKDENLIDSALGMLGSGGGEVRLYAKAIAALEEAIERGLKQDRDYTVTYNRSWLARIAFEQGRWDDAARYAELVMTGRAGSSPIGPVTALGALGRVRIRRGDPGGRELLEQALEIGKGGEMQHLWSPLCGLAELAWLEGREEDISEILAWVWSRALDADSRWARGEVGFWMWKAGAIDGPPERAAKPFALHMSGEWEKAAEGWREIGCPYEEALALAEGDEAAMRQAVGIFDGLGARPAATWLRGRLRERGVIGIPRGPRAETKANPIGLTSRQAEVLGLMGAGLDNSEIAERLFISKKTAEHHVSAVMSKIGASTRAMAIARAGQLGLLEHGGGHPPI